NWNDAPAKGKKVEHLFIWSRSKYGLLRTETRNQARRGPGPGRRDDRSGSDFLRNEVARAADRVGDGRPDADAFEFLLVQTGFSRSRQAVHHHHGLNRIFSGGSLF